MDSEQVRYEVQRECSSSLIWDCSIHHNVMIAPMCWEDILFDLKLRPCVWDQTLPYGFFYRKHASPPLQAFISFVLELLRDETRRGTLPTLQAPAAP